MTSPERKGFTLIELLVSMGLFSIVMTISIGSLLSIVDANRKAQNIQTVVDNVAFGLDSITRNIRTGYEYSCSDNPHPDNNPVRPETADCSTAQSGFEFTTSDGLHRVAYKHENTTDYKGIVRKIDNGGWVRLTAPEALVESVSFFVSGTSPLSTGDEDQPTVTIVVKGTAGVDASTASNFDIQTTATQRQLDKY